MGKRKTRETEDSFCGRAGTLFKFAGDKEKIEKLRRDFYATTTKQQKLVKLIRNEIPNANDSDARNILQELTDRLTHRLQQIDDLLAGFTDRKIHEYKRRRLNWTPGSSTKE